MTTRRTPAVFFHDCRSGASVADWSPLRDRWPATDSAAPPLPGYADSPWPHIATDADQRVAWRAESVEFINECVELTRQWDEAPILLGAGGGGFFALLLAERIPIAGLVTLGGLADQQQLGRLTQELTPVFAVAAAEDAAAALSTRTIANVSFSPETRHVVVPGQAQGTDLLTPGLCDEIMEWIASLPEPGNPLLTRSRP